MKAVRTFIVEDQGMFRAFLEQWLTALPGFKLVGAAPSSEEGLVLLPGAQPELLIIDLQLPGMDGLEFLAGARRILPGVRALVLSSLEDSLALTRVRESGAQGYLEKSAGPAELRAALQAVADGGHSYSPRYRETLGREQAKPQGVGKILSRREQEVLAHILAGRSSRQTAELIGISARTVEFHRANLMGKLGASNAAELITNARRQGLA
ncbi:response regulator [Luteolibacter sp. Populi]|uniref:response regulator n=1 Tax=Luteolibacter sp. Populi TaxID=3230487 RepID=UPI003466F822